jgi:hypothetical protein
MPIGRLRRKMGLPEIVKFYDAQFRIPGFADRCTKLAIRGALTVQQQGRLLNLRLNAAAFARVDTLSRSAEAMSVVSPSSISSWGT